MTKAAKRSSGAVALAVALLAGAACPAPAVEVTNGAKGAPATVRPVPAGALVRAEPLPTDLRVAGTGAAWRILYRSTGFNGKPVIVSGTVLVPEGIAPAGGWPLVSYAHGFGGLGDACAPSLAGLGAGERVLAEALLRRGYALAATDYDGIGTPGESSVVDGRSQAYAVLDAARAARRLAPVSRSLVGVGYSLGGYSTMWAGSLVDTYAPDLHWVGAIALAPISQWVAQLSSPAWQGASSPAQPTAPYTTRSLSITNRGLWQPARFLTPTGRDLVRLAGTACLGEMAGRTAGLTMGDLFTDPAAAARAAIPLFARQEVPAAAYSAPVRVWHGSDDVIPPVLSTMTVGQLTAAGTDASLTVVPGLDHLTLVPTITPDVVAQVDAWLTSR